MTSSIRISAFAALVGAMLPAVAMADPETTVVSPIPPAEQVKIACLEGYEPVITNMERLQNNFAPGTGDVTTNVRSQGQNMWFIEVGVVGQDGQVNPATEYGPHVMAEAECRSTGSMTAQASAEAGTN